MWVYSNKGTVSYSNNTDVNSTYYNFDADITRINTTDVAVNPLSTNSMSSTYCHPTCYLFAFWCITSVYIVMALAIIIACGSFFYLICALSLAEDD